MANKNNFIELNGKRYDASSGVLLGDSKPAHKASPRLVDNFVKAPSGQPVTTISSYTAPTKTSKSRARTPAVAAVKHKPQTSQTLMRSAVNKPAAAAHSNIKVQTAKQSTAVAVPATTSLRKLSSSSVNPHRLTRAQQLQKSHFVRHFSSDVSAPISGTAIPAKHSAKVDSASRKPAPPSTSSRHNVQPSQQLFEAALARANSHEQTYRKPGHLQRRKYIGYASVALSTLLIAGFIAYVNVPNLTMSFASSKAGFHAELPGYRPAGFSVGHFTYSPGSVAVNFTSHSDKRTYSVVQKVSTWDSQALYANFVALTKQPYQTYQNAGRTVYLYGDNSATWVDGGIWYTVQGNDSLSSHQLLEMADSM